MSADRDRTPRFSFGHDPNARTAAPRRRRGSRKVVAAVLGAALLAAAAYVYQFEPETARRVLGDTPLAPPPPVTRAYKWQDAAGGWHLTGEPPPAGIRYEVITVRGDTNVVPAVPAPR